jgi:hypothetical protein
VTQDAIATFLETLASAQDLAGQYALLERWAESSEPERLYYLALALERDAEGVPRWKLEGVFDHLERTLAMSSGFAHAALLARVLLIPRERSVQLSRTIETRQRTYASMLASAQTTETFLKMLSRHADEEPHLELLACWAQELIVRGDQLDGDRAVVELWARLREKRHALAVLPLAPTPIELTLRAYLPSYQRQGMSTALPFGPPERRRMRLIASREDAQLTHTELDEPETIDAIKTAVVNWHEESNGRIEARVFSFGRRVLESEISSDLLAGLPLECLAGANADGIEARIVAADHALALLFAAAANGGAYNSGVRGAYGRLYAWRSVAGLCGKDVATDVRMLAGHAAECTWIELNADGEWFAHVAWDLGLAALRKDGLSLAVLAATDTD